MCKKKLQCTGCFGKPIDGNDDKYDYDDDFDDDDHDDDVDDDDEAEHA